MREDMEGARESAGRAERFASSLRGPGAGGRGAPGLGRDVARAAAGAAPGGAPRGAEQVLGLLSSIEAQVGRLAGVARGPGAPDARRELAALARQRGELEEELREARRSEEEGRRRADEERRQAERSVAALKGQLGARPPGAAAAPAPAAPPPAAPAPAPAFDKEAWLRDMLRELSRRAKRDGLTRTERKLLRSQVVLRVREAQIGHLQARLCAHGDPLGRARTLPVAV